MIRRIVTGNLLDSDCQTLVNTVNCVGVMGKGIALEFKKRFPAMFEDYAARCKHNEVHLGEPYLYTEQGTPWILNFPTKQHWRNPSTFEDIEKGLEFLARNCDAWGIESMAVPPLGCGNGWLDWKIMGPVLYRFFDRLPMPVDLYAPHGTPEEQLSLEFLVDAPTTSNTIPIGHLALVEIIARLRDGQYPPIGQTMAMALCSAATAAGIPTGFVFERGTYGPFSKEAKFAFERLTNNGLLAVQQRDKLREVLPGPTWDDAHRTYTAPLLELETPIARVVELFTRVAHSTVLADLTATVLLLADELKATNASDITHEQIAEAVVAWREDKFPASMLASHLDALEMLDWLPVSNAVDPPAAAYEEPRPTAPAGITRR